MAGGIFRFNSIKVEAFEEKVRQILFSKREEICLKPSDSCSDEENFLIHWVKQHHDYRLPFTTEEDEIKLKMAKTLVAMYGDKVLTKMYQSNEELNHIQKVDKMLDEIIID